MYRLFQAFFKKLIDSLFIDPKQMLHSTINRIEGVYMYHQPFGLLLPTLHPSFPSVMHAISLPYLLIR
jgi:hypothetical protein